MATPAHKVASAVTTLINAAIRKPKDVKTAGKVLHHAKVLREAIEANERKTVRLSIKVP